MKKKLIAAVTSLAMVATMVPATAFATVENSEEPASTESTQEVRAAEVKADVPFKNPTAVEEFVKAVEDIGTISGYSEDKDKKVIDAYYLYTQLNPDDQVIIQNPKPNNHYDDFTKMTGDIIDQWNARLDKLQESVRAVDPVVEMGPNDKESIAAIKNLKKDYDAFNAGLAAVPTAGVDLLWDALGDTTILPESTVKKQFATTQTKVTTRLGEAYSALDDAQAVEPHVIAIAKLPEVTGWNYQEVLDKIDGDGATINGIENDIANSGITDAQKKKIGNYHELKEKREQAQEYKTQVDEVVKLVNRIPGHLDNGLLTKKEIEEYTNAYNAAKKEYDKLDEGQKYEVDNRTGNGLAAAGRNINRYKEGLDKEIAVEKAINTLPSGNDPANTLTIAETKDAWENLSPDTVGKLSDLALGFRDNISDELKIRLQNQVKILLTEGLKDNGKIDKEAIDTAVAPVKARIAALPATITLADEDAVNAADNAYTIITTTFAETTPIADEDALVTRYIKNALAEDEKTLDAAKTQLDKLLTENRQPILNFISAVAKIGRHVDSKAGSEEAQLEAIDYTNQVDGDYYNFTRAARKAYDALTDGQKSLVQRGKVTYSSLAYEKLLVAEKNVASSMTLEQVADLIKAVPNAATLKVDDAAAVAKVKAAQTVYEAMTAGAQKQLIEKNYVTVKELKNYEDALKKITTAENKAAAAAVITLIKNLPGLPASAFSSHTEITTAYDLLKKAEAGYNALTKEQQAAVTNAEILKKYRTDFDRLMKNYADKLYNSIKAVTADTMKAEDLQKIAELKAYIDGGYLAAKDIAGFDQSVYNRLVSLIDVNAALESATVADIPAQTYTGKEIVVDSSIQVTDKVGKTVSADKYQLSYLNNQDAGVATVTISAKTGSGYTGVITKSFTINPASISASNAEVSGIVNKAYTGKGIEQSLTVKVGDKSLARDKDYTQSYQDNVAVGKASVTITGTGNYEGTITKYFVVTPAKESITSLKAGKKKLTVSYNKQTGASYRIIYQKSGSKAKGINTTALTKTIKGLKSGKTYKVKVRAYKTVDGKKYYGSYSAWKKAKVK